MDSIATLSPSLRAAAAPIWEAQHAHPFVRGIADGTLPADPFAHFVRQDYRFLLDYARLLALGAARARSEAVMRRFARLANAVLEEEMELHRRLAADIGIDSAELEGVRAAPTTQAYGDFLVRTAAVGDVAELAAALLPCMWGYAELGERLAAGPPSPEPRYAEWIATYADPEFARLGRWCRELVDELGADRGADGRGRMRDAFVTCSRYELAFWEMAWTLEDWPPA